MGRAAWGCAAGLALMAPVAASGAWPVDGLAVVGASGWESEASMQRLALHWDLQRRWWQGDRWNLTGQLELAVGHWEHPQRLSPGNDVGLTPVLRLTRPGRYAPYFEAAVGMHVLSSPLIGGRDLGTAFQFGDMAGFGLRFGPRGKRELGYRVIHFSNAGIKQPNPGINFHMVRLGFWF